MSGLNEREQKLIRFLRDRKADGATFTVADAVKATGYSEATVKTYLGKKLRRELVESTQDGRYASTIPSTFSESDFRRLMTQVAEDPLGDVLVAAEWKSCLSRVIGHGETKGFRLTQTECDQLVTRLKTRVAPQ